MAADVRLIDVRETDLSIDEVFRAVADPRVGGVCLFVGTVRDRDSDRAVAELSYSAHPTATAQLEAVMREVSGGFPDVVAVAAAHRVGTLQVGDLAVVVAVSAGHRPEAFEACRRLIDELKARVPLWKNQHYVSGDSAWL